MATRMQQLQQLQARMPVANQKAAERLKATADIQRKQAIGKMAPGTVTPTTAGQVGAATAAAKGQATTQAAATTQQQQEQLGGIGLKEQATQSQAELAERKLSASRQDMENRRKLASFGEDVKDKILDSRLRFANGQAQRRYENEVLLADWAAHKARTEEDWRNVQQSTQQKHDRYIKTLEFAHQKMLQKLKMKGARKRERLSQEQRIELKRKAQALEASIRQAKADAANKMMKYQAIGQLVGAGAGFAAGGPVGGAAGAQAGGGVGSMIGGLG